MARVSARWPGCADNIVGAMSAALADDRKGFRWLHCAGSLSDDECGGAPWLASRAGCVSGRYVVALPLPVFRLRLSSNARWPTSVSRPSGVMFR